MFFKPNSAWVKSLFALVFTCAIEFGLAQDHHLDMMMKDSVMKDHEMKGSDSMSMMTHAYSRNLPMTRNASGTGWLPDASVMYGHALMTKKWMFMFHQNLFLRYNHQDIKGKGSRGGEKIDAPNWFMLMGQRWMGGRGLFSFVTMISLDPFTVGGNGYPLLFQTGETYQGRKLVDRQHPHDLFSSLSIAYTHMLSKKVDVTAYLGYPAEPALGPVAFMHRLSALNNPDAPLGHHWQDATHISYGVATLSLRWGVAKIEASYFNAREPDEDRIRFDKPIFNSWSSRLLLSPAKQLILQISRAYLNAPEAAEPGKNVVRTTASVQHHLSFQKTNRYLASALIWGQNSGDQVENSFLAESNLQLDRSALYARYEFVQKDARDLYLPQFINGHVLLFRVQSITVGMSQVILRRFGYNVALGGQASLALPPSVLKDIYGERPVSAEVYLRLCPRVIRMHRLSQ